MDRYLKANAVLSIFAKKYMELKNDLPIRPSEMGILNIITEVDGYHTPVMLAEMLKVSKPMITAHINSLYEKGYIRKEACADDKRAYYILPTEKALDLVNRSKIDMKNQLDQLISEMGQKKFDDLVYLANIANEIFNKGE